jgi:LPS export ABC transporter protein LptC
MHHTLSRYALLALSILGSATLLFSCTKETKTTQYDYETLLTESSENRTITMMENGIRSYTFITPLMEGYSLAANPYQEFRRGINMTTYTQDSLNLVDANITANYAIYYENQRLWEAKGNVIIIKNNRDEGDTTIKNHTEIYTQQLFWNATTKKIYSNVDTKILQPDGWHFGVGFDADEDLKNIHFRKYSSEMEFDMSQPTPEEIEAQNKKNEEANANSNKGNKEANNNKSFNSNNGNKPRSENTIKNNKRPNSNPGSSVKPLNNSPTTTTNKAKGTGRNGQLPATTPQIMAPQSGKRQELPKQQLQTTMSTSLDLSTDDKLLTAEPPMRKK